MVPYSSSLEMLDACLRSLARHLPSDAPIETIVVRNEPSLPLPTIHGADLVLPASNLGLAGAANRARQRARGEFLVLLHDDAEIGEGWLEGLLDAASPPTVGAVGSKVFYHDGRLQSAGSILWRDGRTSLPWLEDPAPRAFDQPRAVDYCGTSSLLVRAAAWDDVGGMDERFYPVYYVDVDFCMALRQAGWQVMFEPKSRILHHQGANRGRAFRAFATARNRSMFVSKWGDALGDQEPYESHSEEALERALRRAQRPPERRRAPAGPAVFDEAAQEARIRDASHAFHREYSSYLATELARVEKILEQRESQLMAASSEIALHRSAVKYAWGTDLTFGRGGTAFRHAVFGVQEPETWGAWMVGGGLRLALPLEAPPPPAVRFSIDVFHFISAERPVSPLRITVDGQTILEARASQPGPIRYEVRLSLPADLARLHLAVAAFDPATDENGQPRSAGLVRLSFSEAAVL